MKTKTIVTNKKELINKYGSDFENAIKPAIEQLIVADEKRGIKSNLFYLDESIEGLDLAVTDHLDEKQNKTVIDAICKKTDADYLLLIGGPDIIPYQKLVNPMEEISEMIKSTFRFYPENPDIIYSDLPYSSSAPYSRHVIDYVNDIDRSAGRIGFIEDKPDTLIAALNSAVNAKAQNAEVYKDYFAIVSKFASDDLKNDNMYAESFISPLLRKIYGKIQYNISPANDWDSWGQQQLNSPMHLLIGHSFPYYPYFLTQGDYNRYFIALSEESIANRIPLGTVAVTSACYGAQIYGAGDYYTCWNYLADIRSEIPDQKEPFAERPGLNSAYFKNGATAFVGSTFWGGDFKIALLFIGNMLNGMATGDAMLAARHRFVSEPQYINEEQLATLASYTLLGDPSVCPVKQEKTTELQASLPPKNVQIEKQQLTDEDKANIRRTIAHYIGKVK